MKRCRLVWIVYLLIFDINGILFGQTNLLKNPGFEVWEDVSQIHFWNKESGCEVARDSTAKCEGHYSVQLKKTGKRNRGIYQDVPVTAGKKYTFRAQVLSTGEAVLGIVITWYSAEQKYLGYSGPKKSISKGRWQKMHLSDKAPPKAITARCKIRVYDGVEVFCCLDKVGFY